MPVLVSILSVRSLLIAEFILMAGSGSLATLMSLRLQDAGTASLLIGLIGTAYYAGLTIGSLRASVIIARVGHIRAFAAFVPAFTASVLASALYQNFELWVALRFIEGLSLAGVSICVESWLNERADQKTRGSILAFYMIAIYAGQGAGQYLLTVGSPSSPLPFIAASILLSLAVVPVVLTHIPSPAVAAAAPMPFRQLYAISPLGIVGVAINGVLLGSFYALGAVYVHGLGLNTAGTALFMSAAILGGIVLQVPIGRLSDRFDRRKVIIGTFAGTGVVALAIGLFGTAGEALQGMAVLFGGLMFTLYPLCVAHTNDYLTPDQRVGASGGLVLIYSIGAAIGPIVAAGVMTAAGNSGLFFFMAASTAAVVGFGLWRQHVRRSVPNDQQRPYQILPRTTPMSASLDPQATEET